MFKNTTTKTRVTLQNYCNSENKNDSNSFLRTWSHILKKSLMDNFIFCAV